MLLNNHGGGCCGVRHICGFDNSTVADLDRYIAQMQAWATGSTGRLAEVILSERQVGRPGNGHGRRWAPCVEAVGGWPAVLAARGFRLVSRFLNNNSGQECFVFHALIGRAGVSPAFLPTTGLDWWTGDVAVVPPTPRVAGAPAAMTDPVTYAQMVVGSRWRITADRRGGHRFLEGSIVRIDVVAGHSIHAVREDGGPGWYIIPSNVERIEQTPRGFQVGDAVQHTSGREYTVADQTQGDRRGEGYTRVRNGGGHRWLRTTNLTLVAPPAPVTVFHTTYHNVLRTGRGAGFLTRDAAHRAAPRAASIDRFEVLSDGTTRWTTGV